MKLSMSGRRTYVICVVSAFVSLFALSSVGTQTQGRYPPAFPRDGAIKLAETDLLTFWEVQYVQNNPSPMFELLLDQVTVTLTEGAVRFMAPGNIWRIEQLLHGSVRYETRGTVRKQDGLSVVPAREIIVQLKDVEPPRWPLVPGIPGQFPRLDAVMLFENARIRVWDQTWYPNRPVTNHLHYTPTAAVFLSAGTFRTRSVGKPPGNPAERYIGFVLPGTSALEVPHEEEWVSGKPRAIWIEFK